MPKIFLDCKLPCPLPTSKHHQYTPYGSWDNVCTRKRDTGRQTGKWWILSLILKLLFRRDKKINTQLSTHRYLLCFVFVVTMFLLGRVEEHVIPMWCACDSHVVCMWYQCDMHVTVKRWYLPWFVLTDTIFWLWRVDEYAISICCACDSHVVCMWCQCDMHVIVKRWYLPWFGFVDTTF